MPLAYLYLFFYTFFVFHVNGLLSSDTQKIINEANANGPYIGVVIPNLFEMNPLLQSPCYTPTNTYIDFAGRRFRFGTIEQKKVILVMTGLGMINAAITTQVLLSLFNIHGVVHYGTAGNASPYLNVGDVVIPQYWAHTGLWNWQRYGRGPEDELALEAAGDYTRDFGYLKFSDYTSNVTNCPSYDNLLNNVWYQPEEVFPVNGSPEFRQHAFWVPADPLYLQVLNKLKDLELEACLNSTTCLSDKPKLVTVERGISASIFVDNMAYRSSIHQKFNASILDMESASVALVCFQQRVPFVAIRALSGSGKATPSDPIAFLPLASRNSVTVVVELIKQLEQAVVLQPTPDIIILSRDKLCKSV